MPRGSSRAPTYIEDDIKSIASKFKEVENIRVNAQPSKAFIELSDTSEDSTAEPGTDEMATEESERQSGFLDTTNEGSQPVESSSDESTKERKAKRGRRTTANTTSAPKRNRRQPLSQSSVSTMASSQNSNASTRRSPRIKANSAKARSTRNSRKKEFEIKEPVSPEVLRPPRTQVLSSDEGDKENIMFQSFEQLSTPSARDKRKSQRNSQAAAQNTSDDDCQILEIPRDERDEDVEKELAKNKNLILKNIQKKSSKDSPQKSDTVTVKVNFLHHPMERFEIPTKTPRGYSKILHTVLNHHDIFAEEYADYRLLGYPNATDICNLGDPDSLERMIAKGFEPIFSQFRIERVVLERQPSVPGSQSEEKDEKVPNGLSLRIMCAQARSCCTVCLPRTTTFKGLKEHLAKKDPYYKAFHQRTSRKVKDKQFQVQRQTVEQQRAAVKNLQQQEYRRQAAGIGLGIAVCMGAANKTTSTDVERTVHYTLYFVDPDGEEIENENVQIGCDDLDLDDDDQVEVRERIIQ